MFDTLTNQFQIHKTFRFDLVPVGETATRLEDFESEFLKGMIERSSIRKCGYDRLKPFLDEIHSSYIEECLSETVNRETGEILLSGEDFAEAFLVYRDFLKNPKSKEHRKAWNDTQKKLREKVANCFYRAEDMDGESLILKTLPEFLEAKGILSEYEETIKSFKGFTGYFQHYFDIRKGIYSSGNKSHTIAYRIIHENMPMFFDDCLAYQKNTEEFLDIGFDEKGDIKPFGFSSYAELFRPESFIHMLTQDGISKFNDVIGGISFKGREKKIGLNEIVNLYKQENPDTAKKIAKFK